VQAEKSSTLLRNTYKYQPQEAKMELQKILPDLVKEVVRQTLESIMVTGRKVSPRSTAGMKNNFERF
jgi:hypothetical protein